MLEGGSLELRVGWSGYKCKRVIPGRYSPFTCDNFNMSVFSGLRMRRRYGLNRQQ